MSGFGRFIRGLGARVPATLYVFVAAIFLANSVNLFTMVYGSDRLPSRTAALLLSSLSSLAAAGMWTVLASKIELIDKTVASASLETIRRERVREDLWNDVGRQVSVYLTSAAILSILALAVLLLR